MLTHSYGYSFMSHAYASCGTVGVLCLLLARIYMASVMTIHRASGHAMLCACRMRTLRIRYTLWQVTGTGQRASWQVGKLCMCAWCLYLHCKVLNLGGQHVPHGFDATRSLKLSQQSSVSVFRGEPRIRKTCACASAIQTPNTVI
jgi:hypothetical protein